MREGFLEEEAPEMSLERQERTKPPANGAGCCQQIQWREQNQRAMKLCKVTTALLCDN